MATSRPSGFFRPRHLGLHVVRCPCGVVEITTRKGSCIHELYQHAEWERDQYKQAVQFWRSTFWSFVTGLAVGAAVLYLWVFVWL